MKKLIMGTLGLATAIATMMIGSHPAFGQPVTLTPQFQPDPVVLQGTSGGSQASTNCGSIPTTPSQVVQLDGDFPYLRFSLQSSGQPTLLIVRLPNGTPSCISADSSSGRINAPGYWEQGNYAIYVGDRAGGQHPYTLSITQRRN